MNRDVDTFLSNGLKSWSTQQHPPADAREHLLQRAAEVTQKEQPGSHRLFRHAAAPATTYWSLSGWLYGPFTQTRMWSFHMATTRVVI